MDDWGVSTMVNIKGIIAVVIVIVVAIVLFPLVQDTVGPMAWDNYSGDGAAATTNGSTQTLLQQVPLFYILGVVLAVIGFALVSVREAT